MYIVPIANLHSLVSSTRLLGYNACIDQWNNSQFQNGQTRKMITLAERAWWDCIQHSQSDVECHSESFLNNFRVPMLTLSLIMTSNQKGEIAELLLEVMIDAWCCSGDLLTLTVGKKVISVILERETNHMPYEWFPRRFWKFVNGTLPSSSRFTIDNRSECGARTWRCRMASILAMFFLFCFHLY
jgi:hypothetical protein